MMKFDEVVCYSTVHSRLISLSPHFDSRLTSLSILDSRNPRFFVPPHAITTTYKTQVKMNTNVHNILAAQVSYNSSRQKMLAQDGLSSRIRMLRRHNLAALHCDVGVQTAMALLAKVGLRLAVLEQARLDVGDCAVRDAELRGQRHERRLRVVVEEVEDLHSLLVAQRLALDLALLCLSYGCALTRHSANAKEVTHPDAAGVISGFPLNFGFSLDFASGQDSKTEIKREYTVH